MVSMYLFAVWIESKVDFKLGVCFRVMMLRVGFLGMLCLNWFMLKFLCKLLWVVFWIKIMLFIVSCFGSLFRRLCLYYI